MIKELSVIPNYLRLFTFVAGTYILTENQIDGKICIGLGVKLIIIRVHISATFTSKFSFPSRLLTNVGFITENRFCLKTDFQIKSYLSTNK